MALTASHIIEEVALYYDISDMELSFSKKRKGSLPRHLAIWLCNKLLQSMSVNEISKVFGYKDHTSALYAINSFETAIQADATLNALAHSMLHSLEFKERMFAKADIDVLKLATKIAKQPTRAAIGASVNDIVALAMSWLEIWELAKTGEYLSTEMLGMLDSIIWSGDSLATMPIELNEARSLKAVSKAILEEMSAIRGEEPSSNTQKELS